MRIEKILLILLVFLIAFSIWACNSKTTDNEIVTPNAEPNITFTDIDGNTYQAKKIGNKYWMIENFKAQKSQTGQTLQGIYVYENNTSNSTAYGRLYTWNAAVEATPDGWHLPSKEEWEELINAQGGSGAAGGNLKETGTIRWNSPNTGATNSSGLTAVGSGFRGPDGIYYDLGKHGSYWGTANSAKDPFCVYIYHNSVNVISEVSPIDKTSGIAFAVRYVKNP
ncbi:MAG: fibrobacter succinogenes major paralogous domain-containing protein [Melioribacteraceae bacterium]